MKLRTQLAVAGCGLSLVVLAGAGVAAFATPKPAAPPARASAGKLCFRIRDVDGVSVSSPIGDKKLDGVNIRLRNRDAYQIALSTICPELQHSLKIGIESRNVTGSICDWSDAIVVAQDRDTGQSHECWASSLHKLTPAELAAIPEQERP